MQSAPIFKGKALFKFDSTGDQCTVHVVVNAAPEFVSACRICDVPPSSVAGGIRVSG